MKTSVNTFIRTYILFLLETKGDMYGKQMIDEMIRRFKGVWSPSHGLVYPILSELEEEGFVKSTWARGSSNRQIKKYKLTKKGKQNYESEKDKLEQSFTESMMMLELFMIDVFDVEMIDFSDHE